MGCLFSRSFNKKAKGDGVEKSTPQCPWVLEEAINSNFTWTDQNPIWMRNLILLAILVSINLIACTGQVQTKSKLVEVVPSAKGTVVSEIDNQIWAVYQDTRGDFWFGSNGRGVYHYDGQALMQFTTTDGLVNNQIRGIQEDENGHIYIETPLGVSKFNGQEFVTLEVVKPPISQWKNESSDLWFNCNGNHLYRCDGEMLYELYLPEQDLSVLGIDYKKQSGDLRYSPYAVYGVDRDKEGNLWIGTIEAGAFRYDGNSFLWIGEKELSTLPDGRVPGVRSMIQDKDGFIWLSNFYSKYKINNDSSKGYEKLKAVDLPQNMMKDKILYFNSGLRDMSGNLWMTTYGGGVWKYDGTALFNIEIHNGKEDVLLVDIFQDREGLIWLGTNNDGVYRQNGEHFVKFVP